MGEKQAADPSEVSLVGDLQLPAPHLSMRKKEKSQRNELGSTVGKKLVEPGTEELAEEEG